MKLIRCDVCHKEINSASTGTVTITDGDKMNRMDVCALCFRKIINNILSKESILRPSLEGELQK